jgi:hypothetical protein
MAFQFSTAARNGALDAIETELGASPVLKLWSGTVPANCAAADSGTQIANMALPADAMAAASGGTKGLSGVWTDASADANGTVGHFRVYKNGATVCVMQGTVTVTGGGGDLTLDNTSVTSGQTITITSFTLTAGGA